MRDLGGWVAGTVVLAVIYFALSVWTLTLWTKRMLFRRESAPSGLWQSSFLLFVVFGSLGRTVFWSMQVVIFENRLSVSNSVWYVVNTLPSFLFFSTYLRLVLLWAGVFHVQPTSASATPVTRVARGAGIPPPAPESVDPTLGRFRVAYVLVNAIMYAGATVIYLLDAFMPSNKTTANGETVVERYAEIIVAVMYLSAACAFVGYGTALVVRIRSSASAFSAARRKVLRQVGSLTTIITVGFSVRSLFILCYVFMRSFSISPYFLPLYYTFCEAIPLVLLIWVLRSSSALSPNKGANGEEGRALLRPQHIQIVPRPR
eukprot:a845590_56.p1 GENE.a845590_56~~a845590_56.p1  ORF type:complete len:328 (+),score=40.57 a845590_56:35-985(+)